MNEEKKHTNFYRMASCYGLIMGLLTSAIQFIYYLLEGKFDNVFVIYAVIFAAVVAIIIKGTLNYRKLLGGYISYWHAFMYGVMIFLFAGIVGAVYSYVLSNIDPEYAYRQIEVSKQHLLNSGLSELNINEFITEMRDGLDYNRQHPFQAIVSAALANMFFGAVFCLISSAFFKKNKPFIINES
jgi:hypothetical protein